MQIAVTVAGYSMGQADTLRKVMAKKRRELVGAERERFVQGCIEQGHPNRLAMDLFDLIEPVRRLRVPRVTRLRVRVHRLPDGVPDGPPSRRVHGRDPHVGQGRQGSQALLPLRVPGDGHRRAAARRERVRSRLRAGARRPQGDPFRSVGGAQRRGGRGPVDPGGPRGGPFVTFADFCRQASIRAVLTKRVLESSIYAGAFDSLGYTRGGLLQGPDGEPAFEKVSRPSWPSGKAEAAGQFSLFGGSDGELGEHRRVGPGGTRVPKRLLLSKEKEMLGQFVTDHPLLGVEGKLRGLATARDPDLEDLGDGDLVTVGGIIGAVTRKYTKRGEPYAQLRLEGLAGGVEVVAFPSVYESAPESMEMDRIVLVTGRVDLRGREVQIRATAVSEPDLGVAGPLTEESSWWTCPPPRARPRCWPSSRTCWGRTPAMHGCGCGSCPRRERRRWSWATSACTRHRR